MHSPNPIRNKEPSKAKMMAIRSAEMTEQAQEEVMLPQSPAPRRSFRLKRCVDGLALVDADGKYRCLCMQSALEQLDPTIHVTVPAVSSTSLRL